MRHLIFRLHDEGLFRNGRPQAESGTVRNGREDQPRLACSRRASGMTDTQQKNISCNIMLQLIFCSVLNGRGQGKTRSHFRRGFLFCSSSGTWMSGTETRLPADAASSRREISVGAKAPIDILPPCPGNGASLIRSGNRSRSSAGTHRPMMFAPLRRSFPSRHR